DVARREFFRTQIFRDLFFRPLLRTSVASRARRFDRDNISGIQGQSRQLSRQLLRRSIGPLNDESSGLAGLAAENARRPMTKAFAGAGKFARMADGAND